VVRNSCAARWSQDVGARKSILLPQRAKKLHAATAIACAAIVSHISPPMNAWQIRWERDSIGGTSMLVTFEIYNGGEFWCARGIGEDIFTQSQTVDDLYANIKEAVALHFENIADVEK
jgi:hypothetical protein